LRRACDHALEFFEQVADRKRLSQPVRGAGTLHDFSTVVPSGRDDHRYHQPASADLGEHTFA
jgi:hypothetical protein